MRSELNESTHQTKYCDKKSLLRNQLHLLRTTNAARDVTLARRLLTCIFMNCRELFVHLVQKYYKKSLLQNQLHQTQKNAAQDVTLARRLLNCIFMNCSELFVHPVQLVKQNPVIKNPYSEISSTWRTKNRRTRCYSRTAVVNLYFYEL